MEVDDIQPQNCKFPRIGNNNGSRSNFNNKSILDDDEEVKRSDLGLAGAGRLCGWPSSRIVRVSRASGGKDRHSKVLTSKGLRDRRVRLSVGTAIQFYDLQDRLGYDQPSKAVEWLLKAAAKSIDELPSIAAPFPEEAIKIAPLEEERFDSGDLNHHNATLSKSACSSTSETSKGSSLSLSRSESRVKARERAKERMADKEKSFIPISQSSSFTELLTGGINNVNRGTHCGQNGSSSAQRNILGFPAMDYSSGFSGHHHHPSGFSGHHSPMTISPYNSAGDPHQELQFSFVQDHLLPVASAAVHGGGGGGGGGGDYNLNFTISSGVAGLNRGTLQSNSQSFSMPQHVQRLSSSSIDGSNVPFFIGNSSPPAENHHHHSQFPAGLQLYYGDGGRSSDQKGKGKN